MTFAAELDDIRQQVRQGTGNTPIVYWPKVNGENVLVDASPTPTIAFYRNDGVVVQTATGVPATTVDGVSMWSINIIGTNWPLGEDHLLEFFFYVNTVPYLRSLRFDVLRLPFSALDEVSINDLLDEYPDARRQCTRQALAQAPGRSPEDQAGILISKAWRDVRNWLRRKIDRDYSGQSFVSLLTSSEDIRPVVVAMALSYMFRSDSSFQAAEEWKRQAEARFSEMPALRFDSDQNRTPDAEVSGFGSFDVERAR